MEKDKEFTVARLILRMANQIVKNRNLHVKALGLTTEQADSLLFFLSHENAVINDLKDYLCVTHQTARGIVQRMEGKGVVTTRKSPPTGGTKWSPSRRRAGKWGPSSWRTASKPAAACSTA